MQLHEVSDYLWEIPQTGAMRVPGRIYANARMMAEMRNDPCLTQVANVACLPGIIGYSLAMPDIHWGYGFPIGGVAAVDAEHGVISPGGVGYDINCGVRLARTELDFSFVAPKIERLADALFAKIPAGVGVGRGAPKLSIEQLQQVTE
jgi:tRNA-splicing ligase RtcB